MKRVLRSQSRSRGSCFDPMEPCIEVGPGEDFVVECHTYGDGIIWKDGDEEGDHAGKLCISVAVRDVEAGDTIAIEIRRIEIVGHGSACIDGPLQNDNGFPGEVMDYFIPLKGSVATLPGGIRAEIVPALGHINVEPVTHFGNPGPSGGNMDLAEASEGNTIYFRAEKAGARINPATVPTIPTSRPLSRRYAAYILPKRKPSRANGV